MSQHRLRSFTRSMLLAVLTSSLVSTSTGCRMAAPIHFWQPALIESTVGRKVVLSQVAGPPETAQLVRDKMIASVPNDAGRQTSLTLPLDLQQNEAIRLVSATDDAPSDIAISAAATQEGYDFVLRGEVLKDRRPPQQQAEDKRLTVSWRLTKLNRGEPEPPINDRRNIRGAPVVVDRESAIARYPDLAMLTDEDTILATAAVRDTYRLITPSIERDQINLATVYLMPGSRDVRRGNQAARAGRWAEAKQIWTDVAENHPLQVAAIHNLALAAAASQDFSTAKKLARKAIRRQPTSLHKTTALWIEKKQREYHEAFNLPDPPEGWFLTK